MVRIFPFLSAKPFVAGMIHFSPLEGDPAFPGKRVVVERAREDLRVLVEGGVDAVMFENNFDNPKFERLPPVTAAHFEELIAAFTPDLPVPWGVSVLWNDYALGFRFCKTYGGEAVRVPVFVDSVETIYGVFEAHPDAVLAARKALNAEQVAILADVQVKHAKMLKPRPLEDSLNEAILHKADAVILTGNWTGDPPLPADVARAHAVVGGRAAILVGSGMTVENVQGFLPYIDGCIVGTAFKEKSEQKTSGPNVVGPEVRYDLKRVRDFVRAVKREEKEDPSRLDG